MDKIFNKFHPYDIMSYLIPGIFTITYIYLGFYFLNFSINLFDNNFLTNSVVFFIVCYYSGLIIHEIGYLIEKYELKKIFEDTYSNNILRKNSSILKEEDRVKCWNILKDHFNIPINLRLNTAQLIDKKICNYGQICYERCRESLKYTYRATGTLNQSEIFNIHYGMSRDLLATSLIAIMYFGFITIFNIVQTMKFPILPFILIFVMYVCSKFLYNRTKRFAKHHVSNTITLYLSTCNNSNSPSFTIQS